MMSDRLIAAIVREGPDGPAARVVRDIIDAAEVAAMAIHQLGDTDPLPEELPDMAAAVDRAWLVA